MRREHIGQNQSLRLGIYTKIPDTLNIGKGNALYLAGWCYHPDSRVIDLQIAVNGVAHPVKAHMIATPDIFEADFPRLDPRGHSLRCGFWVIVPFPECQQVTRVELQLQATLHNGTKCQKKIATMVVKPEVVNAEDRPLINLPENKTKQLIAICMTTYNPNPDLFSKQINSILNQTYSKWICIVSDDCSDPDVFKQIRSIIAQDRRFYIYRNASRLGFYHNFEKCLSLVPKGVQFVTLSDHDDCWYPDKLQTLLSYFDETTPLVYSDMSIVDEKGHRISNTYWTTRPNNYQNLASLLMANTITGAACMFPAGLLSYLLPFPQKVGEPFHDHWIGIVALAMGNVKYVARPLYDYVQHANHVLGHYAPPKIALLKKLVRLSNEFSIGSAIMLARSILARWKEIYLNDIPRLKLMACILDLRCAGSLNNEKKKAVLRLARIDESFLTSIWLALRGLRNVGRVSETLGAEFHLLRGIIWKRYIGLRFRLKAKAYKRGRRATSLPSKNGPEIQAVEFDRIQIIQQKITPLSLRISRTAPRRVNLLIPVIDFNVFFGGYITKFHLARRLAEEGLTVRIVIVDYCEYLPSLWKQRLRAYHGLEELLDCVEVAYAFDRMTPLEVNHRDSFIATTWWTAHIAHQASKDLRGRRFLYLIQEFEPFTFPMGSFAALANQTYTFPHYAIFSTEFLRDYFRQNGIGVFAEGLEAGERHSIVFQNAITPIVGVTLKDMANRSPKRLLFYARPEPHAARNMFELGVIALMKAIETGYFNAEWEFHGIGTAEKSRSIELSGGFHMQLVPRQSQDEYREFLRDHDLGLSLMYTPHPSLVPIEMASAGMLVVTNTVANKTKDLLRAISPNIIAVEPTIEGVMLGLRDGVANIHDYEQRIRGSQVRWSTSWDRSFDEKIMTRIKELLEAAGIEHFATDTTNKTKLRKEI